MREIFEVSFSTINIIPTILLIFVIQSLAFFNVGKVPLMLLLSFIAIPLWFISLTVNYYLQNTSVIISLIFLLH